jgi:flagellar hook-length control protein FliK
MELGPSLAPELLTAADPLSRGPPAFPRPPGHAPAAASGVPPFAWLLQLLGNPLPERLPGGETLPARDAALPATDALPPLVDALPVVDPAGPGAPTAVVPALPSSLPVASPPPAEPAAASGAGAAEPRTARTTAADALRLALSGAPRAHAPTPASVSPAADPSAAARAEAVSFSTEPTAAPSQSQPEAGPTRAAAGLDALRALDAAASAAAAPPAEPFALRPRVHADARTRAAGLSPAELARSSAAPSANVSTARADTPPPVVLEAHAAPELTETQQADAPPLDLPAPAAGAETRAAGAATAPPPSLAPYAPTGAGASATPTAAQLPAHLGTPVDAQSARWHEALASRIHWIVDHEIGEAQIKLNPPELGALDVKISMLDDKTYVQMTAHSSAARDELSLSLPRLRELLSAGGLDVGGATVSGGRDERPAQHAAPSAPARGLAFATDPGDAAADLPRVRLASTSRIDIFA